MSDTKTDTAPQLIVSAAPHLKTTDSVEKIMYSVVVALLPALVGAVYYFGLQALWITGIAVVTAVATEAAIQKFRKVRITALDGSAIVTGILLAFNVPPSVPWWIPVVGTFFAIAIGKHVFGGLGLNPMNPALLGRAFLMASWPVLMTTGWSAPTGGTTSGVAAVTSATPLMAVKAAMRDLALGVNVEQSRAVVESAGTAKAYFSLFVGSVGGCIGETSALLLLVGAAYLFYKKYINYRIPLSYIGTVAILGWIFGGEGLFTGDFMFHILAGGLVLGAFFMATDMVTCPSSPLGQWIFGFGCGLLTIVIRLVGGYPEGVSYSILLMNLVTPLLDRYTKPKVFGA
ncbi:MAG TPA: RnfABCDGE type electron transport complex subunit D [Syntrophales bacterium]|jgi:electron transport complex protein RnfD|nr:RnfABCDGE type electron transport complex subunit D [Syntrophales bacterium]HQA83352.1 RnfABCDGE type electron transport complex subunit D [Syntrophales bacterium]